MINRIIDFSANNRMLIVVLTVCLTLYGLWSMRQIPLDAIPDLSDPQVIIYTEWAGRSPDLIEAQVTYPIVSAMLAAPHVNVVRGSSDYGFSYVYVIFDEGTDTANNDTEGVGLAVLDNIFIDGRFIRSGKGVEPKGGEQGRDDDD